MSRINGIAKGEDDYLLLLVFPPGNLSEEPQIRWSYPSEPDLLLTVFKQLSSAYIVNIILTQSCMMTAMQYWN